LAKIGICISPIGLICQYIQKIKDGGLECCEAMHQTQPNTASMDLATLQGDNESSELLVDVVTSGRRESALAVAGAALRVEVTAFTGNDVP
jgi:hypothetical protein